LGEETCTTLAVNAMTACINSRKEDATCQSWRGSLYGYLQGVDELDHPGFSPYEFERNCVNACETGTLPGYDEFARSVCSLGL
jgi:hypothetical protein